MCRCAIYRQVSLPDTNTSRQSDEAQQRRNQHAIMYANIHATQAHRITKMNTQARIKGIAFVLFDKTKYQIIPLPEIVAIPRSEAVICPEFRELIKTSH